MVPEPADDLFRRTVFREGHPPSMSQVAPALSELALRCRQPGSKVAWSQSCHPGAGTGRKSDLGTRAACRPLRPTAVGIRNEFDACGRVDDDRRHLSGGAGLDKRLSSGDAQMEGLGTLQLIKPLPGRARLQADSPQLSSVRRSVPIMTNLRGCPR